MCAQQIPGMQRLEERRKAKQLEMDGMFGFRHFAGYDELQINLWRAF